MRKLLPVLALLIVLSLSVNFRVSALDESPSNLQDNQPVLPQNEFEVTKDNVELQQITSPSFYSEENKDSFIKGAAIGLAIGIIIGGLFVWFYKKKLD